MEKVKNMKKPAIAVLAVVLVLAVSVMGTLAYLTANQNGDKAVTNTFIAAGGGHLIDPDAPDPTVPEKEGDEPDVPVEPDDPDDPDAPVDPDKPVFGDEDGQLNKGFYLLETKVEYKDNNYVFNEHNYKTLKNDYEKLGPEMKLPKDPKLTADIATDAEAYVFVKVIDTTQGNLASPDSAVIEVNRSNWDEVTGVTLADGGKLYCYYYMKDGEKIFVQTGKPGKDIDAVAILKGNDNYEDGMVRVTAVKETDWVDTDGDAANGIQLGNLEFEAYICQAQGFESPAKAFRVCFLGESND